MTKNGTLHKIMIILILLVSTAFLNGCGTVGGTIKFGAGVIAETLVHQGGHYIGAKISGLDFKWRDCQKSIPGFQPWVEIHNSKPEPWAYGGGLFTEALTSELILWKTDVLKDKDGKKFFTDFWEGYLSMASFTMMNYGIRRSGLFGDHEGRGQNDLSEANFGPGHKLAGAASLAEGGRIAYKLAKGKRTKAYWDKFKLWMNGASAGISYLF